MPIPNVPTNVLVTPGNGRVYLSWSPQSGATSASSGVGAASSGRYDIMRSLDGLNFSLITSINELEYFDTPSTGMLLYYGVRANGNNGQSAISASVVTTMVNFGQTTLGAVRLASQQRADMVNSDFVTKQEWNSYINKSYSELYDILVQTYADEYYVASPFTITTDSRTPALYNLPNNFYKLLGVDFALNDSDGRYATVTKHAFINRNQGNTFAGGGVASIGNIAMQYRIVGQQIHFSPRPGANETIRLWFIPRPVALLADYQVLDGISGWEEYVIVDAAIKAMQKEESDVSVLMAQKQGLLNRITAAASNRDAGLGEAVTDVRGFSYDRWNDFNGGW